MKKFSLCLHYLKELINGIIINIFFIVNISKIDTENWHSEVENCF